MRRSFIALRGFRFFGWLSLGIRLRDTRGDDRRNGGAENSHNQISGQRMGFKILTVCTGNICRSPSAEVILRTRLAEAGLAGVEVDSAGTADYHAGEPPSDPALRLASRRGYDLSALRARLVSAKDFDDFDLILAMDRGHLSRLTRLQPAGSKGRLHLFLEVMPQAGPDLPDPYYGGDGDYEQMLDLIEAAAPAWVARLQEDLPAPT
jgi:protein-tyrosine phosphatase